MIFKTNFTTNKHMAKDKIKSHAYIVILDSFNIHAIMQRNPKG